ncbi:hypothetical protein KDA00_05385 [Candidatus Saccharibacteria bacterium]|nr:hypothetical protein [Candidatus Saccharibacteria bacterium]
MAIKKTLLLAGAIATIGLASFGVIGPVAADTNGNSLADKIATRFNINQDEVQDVIDQHRDDMKAKHQEKLEERLSKAVEDGNITEEQKTKILEKLDQLKQDREANKDKVQNMTQEERKAFMEEKRNELKTWAEENGIDQEYLHIFGGHHGHGGPGFGDKHQ